jgi:serine/threonine-protein kinase
MAEVWRAEMPGHAGFVKEVALKLVRADAGEGGDLARMFVQEAKLASRLHHANIVHVFGFEQVEGRYAIAMELVRGRSLRAVLDRCRETGVRFGLPRAVHVAAEVARALSYAHRPREAGGVAGIVHRDVSPQNVLVSFEGEVKLADFGIARAIDAAGLTNPGTLKGKVSYMAPEQARGEPVDARADVFALGVVLWELCTGGRLFARETEAATLAAVADGPPVSRPSAWNEAVPPELDEVVLAALERDPKRRTATADEMARRLAEIRLHLSRSPDDADLRPLMRRLFPEESEAGGPRPASPAPGGGEDVAPPPAGETAAGGEGSTRTLPGRRLRRQAFLAAVAGGAVALAAAGVAAWRRSAEVPRADAAGPEAATPARRDGAPAAGRDEASTAGEGRGPDPAPRPAALGGASASPEAAPHRGSAAAPPAPPGAPPGPPRAEPAAPGAGAPAGAPAAGADDARRAVRPPSPGAAASRQPPEAAPGKATGGGLADRASGASRAAAGARAASPPAEGAAAAPPPARARAAVRATGKWRGALEVPPARSGDGILFVNAEPWAWVHVGGVEQGDTPLELRLPAGRHALRLVGGDGVAVERVVDVRAGERQDLLVTPKSP